MQWLRDFENERGVAYVLAIVSIFAPGVLASFWLDSTGFESRPWVLTVILAGAVGGISNGISIVGSVVEGVIESKKTKAGRVTDSARKDVMVGSLALGPTVALVAQGTALVLVSKDGGTFQNFVTFSAGISVIFAAAIVVAAWLRGLVKDKAA